MFCSFEAHVKFTGEGLLGGIHEYNPYFGCHGTWSKYKTVREILMTQETPGIAKMVNHGDLNGKIFTFDDRILQYKADEILEFNVNLKNYMRSDDSIWFELWCHTRNSGLQEIDENESKMIERHVSCGVFQLELYNLFKSYQESGSKKSFKLTHLITDPKIVEIRLNEYKESGIRFTNNNYASYVEKAMKETHKGIIEFEIFMKEFNTKIYLSSVFNQPRLKTDTIHSVLHHPQSEPFNSPMSWLVIWWLTDHQRTKKHGQSYNAIQNIKNREYEENQLHSQCQYLPLSYNTEKGQEKMNQSLNEYILKPYCHHFLTMNNIKPLYKPLNPLIGQLQFPMHITKMGRGPVCNYWRCSDPSMREYASEEEKKEDFEIYGFKEKTEKHLIIMVKDSLRRHGMSIEVFIREIENHFSPKNKSPHVSYLFLICEYVIAKIGTFAANSTYYTSDYRWVPRKKGKKLYHDAIMVLLDSWDNTVLNNIGNSDDCDGMDKIATMVLRSYRIGRYDLGFKWQSQLMNTVKLYLENRFIYDIGATVTSSYMDTSNKKESSNKKSKDLPMIGDSKDRSANRGGHCYGLMGSRTDALIRIKNGNLDKKLIEKVELQISQCPFFTKRELECQIIILEPTSSIDGRILPVAESYGKDSILYKKCKAERLFIKKLQKNLKERSSSAVSIHDMYHPEGQPYYLDEQDPNRCVSTFYNECVHACSVEMMDLFGPTVSQISFCTKVGNEWRYGVKIANFIRNPNEYAFITPFNGKEEEWHNHVKPLMETLQRQQPIMSFGRYSDEEYATIHSTYNHHTDISVTYDFESTKNPELSEKEAIKFETLMSTVAENPNLTMVRLYSKPWKFQQNEQKNTALKEFLSSMPGIVAIAYYTSHHLPICDPIVEILCIIDVQYIINLKKFFFFK